MNAVITQDVGIPTQHQDLSNKSKSRIGELLAQARQAKQLDIKMVAQKLHLSVATIQSLEQEQFDKIRDVFVRGYIKKYARLLELNENDLPLLSNAETALPLPRPSAYTYELQREIRSNHVIVQIVTWLIILGLISLFGLWWQGQLEWEDSVPSVPQMDAQLMESNNTDHSLSALKPINSSNDSLSNLPDKSLLRNSTTPVSGSSLTTTPIPTEATPAAPPLAPLPTPSVPPSIPIQPPIPVLPTPTSTQSGQAIAGNIDLVAPNVPATPSTPLVEIAPQHEIMLKILGTSNIEVTDATEKFKLSGKMHKGEKYTFEGKPPYNIVLEKVSAVKLTVDGNPFKIKSRSRRGSASFTLDPNKLEP